MCNVKHMALPCFLVPFPCIGWHIPKRIHKRGGVCFLFFRIPMMPRADHDDDIVVLFPFLLLSALTTHTYKHLHTGFTMHGRTRERTKKKIILHTHWSEMWTRVVCMWYIGEFLDFMSFVTLAKMFSPWLLGILFFSFIYSLARYAECVCMCAVDFGSAVTCFMWMGFVICSVLNVVSARAKCVKIQKYISEETS